VNVVVVVDEFAGIEFIDAGPVVSKFLANVIFYGDLQARRFFGALDKILEELIALPFWGSDEICRAAILYQEEQCWADFFQFSKASL